MSKFQSYSIDDGHGNTLAAGLQPHLARKIAQEKANERQESVWLYDPSTCREGLENDGEEIEPEECEGSCSKCGASKTFGSSEALCCCDAV